MTFFSHSCVTHIGRYGFYTAHGATMVKKLEANANRCEWHKTIKETIDMEFKSKPRAYAAYCNKHQYGNSVFVCGCGLISQFWVCRRANRREKHFCHHYCCAIWETIRVDTSHDAPHNGKRGSNNNNKSFFFFFLALFLRLRPDRYRMNRCHIELGNETLFLLRFIHPQLRTTCIHWIVNSEYLWHSAPNSIEFGSF